MTTRSTCGGPGSRKAAVVAPLVLTQGRVGAAQLKCRLEHIWNEYDEIDVVGIQAVD